MIGLLLLILTYGELMENPVDINHATYYEISEIPFLRDDQINLILKSRPFKDFDDFRAKTRLDPITLSLIRDYIFFSPTVLKRAKISFFHTRWNYFDLFLNTERLSFSFNARDTLTKYRLAGKTGDFYAIVGTITPTIPKFAERPRVSSSPTPGVFADYRGFSVFLSKSRYLLLTPSFHGLSVYYSKGMYGLIFKKGSSLSKFMFSFSMVKKPVIQFAFYRRVTSSYFSAGLTYSQDTVRSSIYFSTLMELTGFLTLKVYSRTMFGELPTRTSYFELYFPTKVSVRYRVYEGRTSTLRVSSPVSETDTISIYFKLRSRSNYGINVELAGHNISAGVTLITTDGFLSVRERGIRYLEYISCGIPYSDVYLTVRKSVNGFDLRAKVGHAKSSGLKFHLGGSYRWQL